MLRCVRKLCPQAALHRIQIQLSSRYATPQIFHFFNFHYHQKKISSLAYEMQKNWFLGYHFGAFLEKWPSLTKSKYLPLEHLLIAIQKIAFWGVHLGACGGVGTPKPCQNICRLNIYWYKKEYRPSLSNQTINFWKGCNREICCSRNHLKYYKVNTTILKKSFGNDSSVAIKSWF